MADFDENGDLPFDQLSDEDKRWAKESIAKHCHEMLDSRRDVFIIGPQTFAAAVWREPDENTPHLQSHEPHIASITERMKNAAGRTVNASVIRRVLDWAENDWPMSLGDFLSGMFFGKEWDRKTPPWKLVPEAQDRMSAESLGFGHLYPSKE